MSLIRLENVAGIGVVDEEQNNRHIFSAGFVILRPNAHIRMVDRVVNHKIRHDGENNDENLMRNTFWKNWSTIFFRKQQQWQS